MSKLPWLKIGAVAALWTIILGASAAGFVIGRSDAARQVSELRQRLAADTPSKQTCGIEVDLLDSREADRFPEPPLLGIRMDITSLRSPGYLHLREMLTSR